MKTLTPELHQKLIVLADAHQKADEYVSGRYDWHGSACAIGCTIRDAKKIGLLAETAGAGDHSALDKLGVPEVAWRLCDSIFEGLAKDDRSSWPPRFLRAIKPGSDYRILGARIMARCADKLSKEAVDPVVAKNCKVVSKLWDRRAKGDEPQQSEWDAARQQAYAALQRAGAARQRQQAHAARQQAHAARQEFWNWCADMLCEELAR